MNVIPAQKKKRPNWIIPALLGGAGLGALAYGLRGQNKPTPTPAPDYHVGKGPVEEPGAYIPNKPEPYSVQSVLPDFLREKQVPGWHAPMPYHRDYNEVASDVVNAVMPNAKEVTQSSGIPFNPANNKLQGGIGAGYLGLIGNTIGGATVGKKSLLNSRLAGVLGRRILPGLSGYAFGQDPMIQQVAQDATGLQSKTVDKWLPKVTSVATLHPVGAALAPFANAGSAISSSVLQDVASKHLETQKAGDLLMKAYKAMSAKNLTPALMDDIQNAKVWLDLNKSNLPQLRENFPTYGGLADRLQKRFANL